MSHNFSSLPKPFIWKDWCKGIDWHHYPGNFSHICMVQLCSERAFCKGLWEWESPGLTSLGTDEPPYAYIVAKICTRCKGNRHCQIIFLSVTAHIVQFAMCTYTEFLVFGASHGISGPPVFMSWLFLLPPVSLMAPVLYSTCCSILLT